MKGNSDFPPIYRLDARMVQDFMRQEINAARGALTHAGLGLSATALVIILVFARIWPSFCVNAENSSAEMLLLIGLSGGACISLLLALISLYRGFEIFLNMGLEKKARAFLHENIIFYPDEQIREALKLIDLGHWRDVLNDF